MYKIFRFLLKHFTLRFATKKILKSFFRMQHGAKVSNKNQPCCIIVYEDRLAEVLPGGSISSKTLVVSNPLDRQYYIDFALVRGGRIIEELK
jgi:hypothetical protein